MKKMIYTLFVIALVASSTAFAAKVTTVALSYEDGQTVARIDVQGAIRFAHQTEVPKDGKGHRVILDVLAATHALSAKTFDHLPECQVTAIRTSQFSVNPEQVVRVVFDVTKAPLYRVEQKGNSIFVYFTDKGVKPFTSWSSSNVTPVPAKETPTPPPATAMAPKPATTVAAVPATPTQQRKTAETDRMTSLSNAPAPTMPAKPASPVTESKPVAKTEPATVKQTTTSPVTVAQKPTETVKTEPKPMVPATPIAEPKPMVPATVAATAPTNPVASKPTVNSPAPAEKTTVVADKKATITSTPVVKPATTVATAPVEKKETAPKVESPLPKPVVASTPTVTSTKPVENKPAVTPTSAPAPTVASANAPVTPKPAATIPTAPLAKPVVAQQPTPTTVTTPKPGVKPEPKPATPTSTPTPVVAANPAVRTAPATPPTPTVATTQPVATKLTPSTEPAKTATPSPAQPSSKPSEPTPVVAKTDATPKPAAENKKDIPAPDFSNDTIAEEDLMVAVDPNSPSDDEEVVDDTSMYRPNDTSSTARFRRNPAALAKAKGTMIAEFPKRLVVKYEEKGRRDPFATLIDDSRTTSGPTEKAIPNIDGLRLVGVIESTGPRGNRALFEDKDGFSYILESGDKVQKGYVLRIEDNTVYFQIFEYGWTRTVALKMEEI